MYNIRPTQMGKLIDRHYKAKIPLFVYGGFGIGKSCITRDTAMKIAESRNREFVEWNKTTKETKDKMMKTPEKFFVLFDERLSQYDPTDIRGLPDFINNNGDKHAEWRIPLWLAYNTHKDADGVIFFDEMNQAPPSIQNACFQVLHDREVAEYKLNDNVLIIACGNRLEDKAHIHDMPLPLRDRMSEVELTLDDESWFEWAFKNDIDSRLIVFLKFKPSYLYKVESDRNMKSTTPRGIEQTSVLINDLKEDIDMKDLVSGRLGEAFATELMAFLKLQRKINIADIIKNPKKVKGITEIDLRFSLISGVLEFYKKDRKKHIEALSMIAEYFPPEFATLQLKLMKAEDKNFFKQNIIKCKNWDKLATEFGKYLLD